MRRMLSGFLATAMVASVCATMSFAAQPMVITKGAAIPATIGNGDSISKIEIGLDFDNDVNNGNEVFAEASVNKEVEFTGPGAAATAQAEDYARILSGVKFHDVEIDGKYYNITLNQVGRTGTFTVNIGPAAPAKPTSIRLTLVDEDDRTHVDTIQGASTNGGWTAIAAADITDNGNNKENADIEQGGQFDVDDVQASDVLITYSDGTPVPLTESGVGVDKDQNSEGGAQSSKTVYFMIRDDGDIPRLADDSYWKLKITKGDNGKYIKAISDVSKKFSSNLVDVNTGSVVLGTGVDRHRYIKVELNEIFTDDEIKISLDMRLSAKSKAVNAFTDITDDTDIKVKDFTFYMKNIVKDADNDWRVGIEGLMLNPVKNDWNEVTYYDEDGDVAFMKFFGDSDTNKFYSKLSTKWEHADYASYFNDQDAYIFQFTGSPSLSSTSRADLEIYSPFIDDNGNETFDPEQAVIYQVVDGDLFDITDSFEYREGNNGDMAFCTRTRFLGTYIICQKPVEEASNDDVVDLVPDDVVPDNNAGAPVEVNPGNNNGGNGGKTPANTGKF